VVLHGYARFTQDIDLAIESDARNRDRLAAALNELNARPVRATAASPAPLTRTAFTGPFVSFDTDAGRIDLLKRLMNVPSIAEVRARAEQMAIGAATVPVASIDDLIAMKTGTGRPLDEADIAALESIQSGEYHREP